MSGKNIDLDRVTHSDPVPPQKPARPDAAGVVNAMPLKPGQPTALGSGLTPAEEASLAQLGWQPGDPIPSREDVQYQMQAMRAAAQEVAPPVPLDTPPLQFETVDISQRSPEEQARIQRILDDKEPVSQTPPAAKAPNAGPLERLFQQEPVSIASQAVPGYREHGSNVAPQPQQAVPQRPQPANQQEPPVEVEIDMPEIYNEPPYVENQPQPTAEPEAAKPTQPASGLNLVPQECQHCGGDLSVPAVPEPSYAEKQAFLHSMLGQKPFIQEYSLLGGNVRVRFRTLTTSELDLIYKQAQYDQDSGKFSTQEDYFEFLNRYRMYLQLLRFEASSSAGFSHDLPDGYNKEVNPNCETTWKFNTEQLQGNPTGLPLIAKYITNQVLKTETAQRIVNSQCMQFNRLVAKMEAVANNSDFWQLTAPPS